MNHAPVPTMPELVERGLAVARPDARNPKRVVYTATPEGQAEIYAAMAHNAALPALPPTYRRAAA